MKGYKLLRLIHENGVIFYRLDSLSAYNRLGGMCDYPILNPNNFTLVWDYPYKIPKYVKKWVRGIMSKDGEYLEQHFK